MFHTVTKRLEICIDINIEISEKDHYASIFTSRIFRLALIFFYLTSICSYKWLTSYSHKLENLISGGWGANKGEGGGNFFEKKK